MAIPRVLAGSLALALALGTFMPLAVAAPAPAAGEKLSGPERIRKALDQTITLEWADMPLPQAVSQLRDQTKVNFILDRAAIQQMGIVEEELLVSVTVQNTKVRTALRTFLNQYNLGYAILGDAVIISTAEMATYRQLRQPVSLDLDSVPFGTAVKQLARQTTTNVVIDSRVAKEAQAPVTLQLDDIPLDTAVRIMAEMSGLKVARLGNVLYVTTEAQALKLRTEGDLTPLPGPMAVPGAAVGMAAGALIGPAIPVPPPPALPPMAVPAQREDPAVGKPEKKPEKD